MSKLQDAQQNVSVLRREAVELANDITLKHSELDSLKKSIKSEYDSLEKEKALLKQEDMRLTDLRKQQAESANQHLLEVDGLEQKKKYLGNEIKEATKELVRVNAWTLGAKDDLALLYKKGTALQKELENRIQILSDIELLRDAKAALSQEVLKYRIELSEMSNTSKQSFYLAKQAKDNELEEYKRIKLEREKEEIALYNIREHRIQIEHDISIYVGRAQIIYKKAFPELEMKL